MLKRTSKQLSLFSSLEDMLSHEHPLFQLEIFEKWLGHFTKKVRTF